jgi:hypothetical protein
VAEVVVVVQDGGVGRLVGADGLGDLDQVVGGVVLVRGRRDGFGVTDSGSGLAQQRISELLGKT